VSKNETESSRAKGLRAEIFLNALAALKRGDVIVFPTETLYGLGADALNSAAVEKVFRLKGRDSRNPIPVLVADRAMLNQLVVQVSPLAEKLMDRFWPGPLTLVLPGRSDLPRPLLNSAGGVGVRISSQTIATELVRGLGRPLTATSANQSGKQPGRSIEEARNYFGAEIEIFVDGGELVSKTGSTVAEIIDDTIRVIRDGEIGRNELQSCAGKGEVMS
jgi:L-threonylcarbamoyladenylate synthase